MNVNGAATRSMLRMRCRLAGPVNEGRDEFNHEPRNPQKNQPTVDDLHCYAFPSRDRLFLEDGQKVAVTGLLKILVPRDTIIDEDSTIQGIYDRRGNTIYAGPLNILGVTRRADHLAITARQVG